MAIPTSHPVASIQRKETGEGGLTLFLTGQLTVESCADLLAQIPLTFEKTGSSPVIFLDLAGVTQIDEYGVLVINEIKEMAARGNRRLDMRHTGKEVEKVLSLYASVSTAPPHSEAMPHRFHPAYFISEIGETAIGGIKKTDSSISFFGAVFFAIGAALFHPRSMRVPDMITFIKKSGLEAIPIVGLVSIIIGLILAFVASVQLEQFGGHLFIPAMITFGMVAEVGPMMTAIVIAGRTGSAYAAEIGTMKISEEIDALISMGFAPILFLVVPRMAALLVALPILTVFSVIAAIFGGFLVCVTMLGLMPGPFLQGVINALALDNILWGLAKSAIFAVLIALIGCLRGLQVRGGAAAVGNAATSAVVSSIFMIILTDSVCAVIRLYWG